MRKTILLALALCMAGLCASAKDETVKKYRRSSLYTIMMPSDKLTGDAKKIVTATFDTMAIPDKFNNHNLSQRTFDLSTITVSDEEIAAITQAETAKKKGFGKFMKMAKGFVSQPTSDQKGKGNDDVNIAKLLKYFKENKIANKLVGKWYGESAKPGKNGSCFNYDLISERGLQNAAQEELAMADIAKMGRSKIMDNAADELIPNTFVMVTYYGYMSAEEIIDYITALADASGAGGYASLGGMGLKMFLKGYFVKTSSYLFQLEWNKDIRKSFEEKYYMSKDTKAFDESDEFQLKYVGKTWDYAPATMKLSFADAAAAKLISRATERATDGSIAKLQKKYDVFRTLSTVHVDGDKIYAYIGKKEGLDDGDKFDVIECVNNEDGTTTYNKVTTIKVAKDKVWDNRAGAGEKLEGEAQAKADKDIDPNATYTEFDGNAKKILDGMFIKQAE